MPTAHCMSSGLHALARCLTFHLAILQIMFFRNYLGIAAVFVGDHRESKTKCLLSAASRPKLTAILKHKMKPQTPHPQKLQHYRTERENPEPGNLVYLTRHETCILKKASLPVAYHNSELKLEALQSSSPLRAGPRLWTTLRRTGAGLRRSWKG